MSKAEFELATFGAGCFWQPQEVFMNLPGVEDTTVGYMGGNVASPTYAQVCSDDTGHAEVLQIKFDSSIISYEQLLRKFWEIHDPTQMNRQGSDVGSQYRSVVFYYSSDQQATAERVRDELQDKYNGNVVTEISPADTFYEAEDYHQKYYQKASPKNIILE